MEQVFLDWALERRDKEHVSFTNFVKNFGLTNRESATRSFEVLLQSSRIPSKRRTFLNAKFDKFREHYAEQFWTKYSLRLNSERTAQRLALAAQDTAVEEAEAAYGERRNAIAAALSSTTSTVTGLVASSTSSSTSSLTAGILTGGIHHPSSSLPPDNIHSSKSMKHPRDAFDDEGAGLPKTPRNKSPSPSSIPTESLDSPPVYTAGQERDPFQAYEDDDEDEEEDGNAGAGEENDVLLPDNTDQAFRFSAMLDGIDVAIGFQSLFTHIKKTKVYIDATGSSVEGSAG
ncbi:hypothetical protein BGZ58_005106, partial [Dissophora ornata]